MSDLMTTVMPGVNAAIEQGYADPDRLAVMGQSYGAHSALSLIVQTSRFKAAVITAAVGHPDLFAAYTEMGSDGTASVDTDAFAHCKLALTNDHAYRPATFQGPRMSRPTHSALASAKPIGTITSRMRTGTLHARARSSIDVRRTVFQRHDFTGRLTSTTSVG